MLDLKNKYSITKKVTQDYTEFEYRKIFTWVDFLIELKEKVKNQKLLKEELEFLNNKITRGYRLQLTLDRTFKDYETFQDFYSYLSFNISLQDDVIHSINTYLDNLQEYIRTEEPKGNPKRIFELDIDE